MSARIAATIAFAVLVAALFSAPAGSASAAARCKNVRGHVTSHTVTENCSSPIALCAAGQFYGAIRGEFFLVATSLTPTQDTPATGVYIYTGDTVIKTKEGDIHTKDAGALNLTPGSTGDDISIVTITGGTGAYAGATGRLRASGTFSESGGEFSYEGEVCTP
ncbi:MAG TPA: hypothetical protein VK422_21620 [Pyrinomonadaceae bacterium]|nr:hypothetical protein [Pyrinomonadaceae bacterium]